MRKISKQDHQDPKIVKSQIVRGFCNFAKANYGLNEKETVELFEKMLKPKLDSLLSEISSREDRQQERFEALEKLCSNLATKARSGCDDWQSFVNKIKEELSAVTIPQIDEVIARLDEHEEASQKRHEEEMKEIRKNRKSSKIVLVVFVFVLVVAAVAIPIVIFLPKTNGFEYENFWVDINKDGKTATISISRPMEEINIPSVVTDKDGNSYTVTSIGKAKMADNNKVQTINMSNGVLTIEASAFEDFNSLKQIALSEEIKKIGQDAFLGCSQLQTVNIGSLENWCKILFEGENSNPLSVAENSVLMVRNKQFAGDIEIPDNIDTLPDYTFHNCPITSIDLANVTTIGKDVFANCTNLKKITISDAESHIGRLFGAESYVDQQKYIPQSVEEVIVDGGESIDRYAFYGCSNLTHITIPESVTTIDGFAFEGCNNLIHIAISQNITSIGIDAFSSTAFYNDPNSWQDGALYLGPYLLDVKYGLSGNFSVKQGTKTIAEYAVAFSDITKINIPASVVNIGPFFSNSCEKLESIEVDPANPVFYSSGNCLIEKKSGILIAGCAKSVIPNGVVAIGKGAFWGQSELRSISLPSGVTRVENFAFSDCTRLTDIKILGALESIEYYAFADCRSLTEIVLPNSLTSIRGYAFSGCTSLKEIVIPDNVTSIGLEAFSGCTELMDIVIGNGVTRMWEDVFKNCTSLTIYCKASEKPLGWNENWNPDNRPVVWGYKAES